MKRSSNGLSVFRGTGVVPVLLLSILTFLSSCAPQHPRDMQRVDSLRYQAEDLLKAQSLMAFNSSAFGARSNQDSLYKANSNLFTIENVKLLRRAEREEPDPVQKKRLRYFRRYLTTEYVAQHIAPITDSIANIEATARVSTENGTLPYRDVSGTLANEPDQQRREALYRACDPLLDTLNLLHRRAIETSHRLAIDLDYSAFNAMMEELKDLSLERLKNVATSVLAQTDSIYKALLIEELRNYLKLDIGQFHRYDTGILFRNRHFDRFFPSSSMLPAVKTTYRTLGIDIDGQKNLTIDDANRPSKDPRAYCFAIDVPGDIRLSIKPIGGFDDYSALFHEMGHAQHYVNTWEHALEFKYLGEPTVTETYAFLSEYILANQAWLRSRGTMPPPVLKDFLRFQAFYRLYYVRRYCAKVLYEIQLHDGAVEPGSLYADLLCNAIGYQRHPSDEKRHLIDVDAHFYSASYLQAWFLESQLNARLTRDFGFNWFEYPQAGSYIRSLWAQGDRLNANEFVQSIGENAIVPDAWLNEIRAMVQFSSK